MNGDAMDELLSIYRRAARETPAAPVDARILRVADRVAMVRRIGHRAAWPSAAAALLLLWFVANGFRHASELSLDMDAGLDAGRTRAELLRMDVTPPSSEQERFLMSMQPINPPDDTRNAP